MIEVIGADQSNVALPPKPAPGMWLRVSDPSEADIKYLQRSLNMPKLFIGYALDTNELARIERDNGHMFIILRIPHHLRDEDEPPFVTTTLGLAVFDGTLVTISEYRSHVLNLAIERGGAELARSDIRQLILLIMLLSAERFLQGLRTINELLAAAELRMERTPSNELVLDMLRYRRTLTYFVTAIKSNRNMLEVFARQENYAGDPASAALLDDVILEYDQAEETSQVIADVIDQYTAAIGALIGNSLNNIMKYLSSFAIILSVPVVIAGFFGMNVSLPFEDLRWAFGLVIGMSFALALTIAYLFHKRGLL